MEIWNPGNFPDGYEPMDFIKEETASILRNPLIANVLYLSEDIEKWGSGLKRIYEECESNNVKVNFNVMKYGFSVIFERNVPVKDGVKDGVKINKTQNKILQLIKEKPEITAEELSNLINISKRNVEKNISKLKELGLLKRVGSDKTGYWEVV